MIPIHAPSKHPSSMQTVEVFAKPGCSREPRKIPNEITRGRRITVPTKFKDYLAI
jgi:hypothetical protein